MNKDEIYIEIERLKKEIVRIEKTFPSDCASLLIKDINRKIDKLLEYVCPF